MDLDLSLEQGAGLGADDPLAYRTLWKNDGRYAFAAIDKRVRAVKRYSLGDQALKPLSFVGSAHYGVIESIHDDATYVCPNCGAPSTLSGLTEGCGYCRTVYTVDDFGLKVSSFSLRPDRLGDTTAGAKGFRKLFVFLAPVVFAASFLVAFILQKPALPFGLIPVLFSALIVGGMLNAILYGAGSLLFGAFAFKQLGSQAYLDFAALGSDRSFSESSGRFDPLFSVESFVANIENKLLAVLFADDPRQVEALFAPGCQAQLPRFHNAFDCNLTGASFVSFQTDANYQYLSVAFALDVYRLEGRSVKLGKEGVELTAVRSIHCRTQHPSEARLTRCGGCGSSINLLDGGKCRFCRSDLRLWEHDWALSSLRLR
jgi:hypothetical protein